MAPGVRVVAIAETPFDANDIVVGAVAEAVVVTTVGFVH